MNEGATNSIDFVKVIRWIVFSIVLPLFPMLLAVLILLGQNKTVQYESLLGGTEIFIISVTVLASTKNDLDNARTDFSRLRIYKFLTIFLLPYAIFISMLFGVIFINEHVQDFGLAQAFIANAGIIVGIIASFICISLQTLLSISDS